MVAKAIVVRKSAARLEIEGSSPSTGIAGYKQLEASEAHNLEVAGSSPVPAIR